MRRGPGGLAAAQPLGTRVVHRPTAGRGAYGDYSSPGRASSRVALRGRNAAKWRPFLISQWEKAGSEAGSEVGREDGGWGRDCECQVNARGPWSLHGGGIQLSVGRGLGDVWGSRILGHGLTGATTRFPVAVVVVVVFSRSVVSYSASLWATARQAFLSFGGYFRRHWAVLRPRWGRGRAGHRS